MGEKKVKGRKRQIVVDTQGNLQVLSHLLRPEEVAFKMVFKKGGLNADNYSPTASSF